MSPPSSFPRAPGAPEPPPAAWIPPAPLPGALWTARTRIRAYRPQDAQALFEAVNVDREALLPWLPWAVEGHRTLADSLATIQTFEELASRQPVGDYSLGIFAPDDRQLLGGTGLHRLRAELREAEVGYWIRGDQQGLGLATEAVGALIHAAFTVWGLRRIRLTCAGGNGASSKVARKLGLRQEARFSADRYVPGRGWQDSLEFAVRAQEWDAQAGRGPGGTSLTHPPD